MLSHARFALYAVVRLQTCGSAYLCSAAARRLQVGHRSAGAQADMRPAELSNESSTSDELVMTGLP